MTRAPDRRPGTAASGSRKATRVRLLRPAYFVWIAVPLALFGIYQLYGLPHVIWSYSYNGGESGFASRWYTRCIFIGPYGAFTVPASDGRCGWVLFAKDSLEAAR